MEWINYHHLLYFWVVAREGGLVPAGKVLRLSHPTLSSQIHALEDRLGEKLFNRVGRRLVLTETGRIVFRYADEIFTLGQELVDAIKARPTGQPVRLNVGIVDVLPKFIVRKLIEPALQLDEAIRLVCFEDSQERLLAQLALHELDIVLSDAPVPSGSSVRAYNHLLGESGVTFFGTKELAMKYHQFPASLDNAPMILPMENTPLRRALNQWFESVKVKPKVIAECEDSALVKALGADGLGIFTAPSVVDSEVCTSFQVKIIGKVEAIRERFYAISAERRLKNPAVVAICQTARKELFARLFFLLIFTVLDEFSLQSIVFRLMLFSISFGLIELRIKRCLV
jgi:LysR family transcriptional regulator, transcriptional activator of nhaA